MTCPQCTSPMIVGITSSLLQAPQSDKWKSNNLIHATTDSSSLPMSLSRVKGSLVKCESVLMKICAQKNLKNVKYVYRNIKCPEYFTNHHYNLFCVCRIMKMVSRAQRFRTCVTPIEDRNWRKLPFCCVHTSITNYGTIAPAGLESLKGLYCLNLKGLCFQTMYNLSNVIQNELMWFKELILSMSLDSSPDTGLQYLSFYF